MLFALICAYQAQAEAFVSQLVGRVIAKRVTLRGCTHILAGASVAGLTTYCGLSWAEKMVQRRAQKNVDTKVPEEEARKAYRMTNACCLLLTVGLVATTAVGSYYLVHNYVPRTLVNTEDRPGILSTYNPETDGKHSFWEIAATTIGTAGGAVLGAIQTGNL